jgi:hypothetical protein
MYARVFTSLFDGSMRGHSDLILVFVNCLCHADKDGMVDRTCRAIADETGLSVRRVESAIGSLESPDNQSRSRNDDGRRLKRVDPERSWGWEIVNFRKYDAIRNSQERREYMRDFMREKRKTHQNIEQKSNVSTLLAPVSNVSLLSVSASVSASAEKDKSVPTAPILKSRFEKPTPAAVTEYGKQIGFELDGNAFFDHYESRGWKYKGGLSMKDWKAAVRTWKRIQAAPRSAPAGQREPFPGETLKLLAESRSQKDIFWSRYAVMGPHGVEVMPQEHAAEWDKIKARVKELERMI